MNVASNESLLTQLPTWAIIVGVTALVMIGWWSVPKSMRVAPLKAEPTRALHVTAKARVRHARGGRHKRGMFDPVYAVFAFVFVGALFIVWLLIH